MLQKFYLCFGMTNAQLVRNAINQAGKEKMPFLFGVDFELEDGFFVKNPLQQSVIRFQIGDIGNCVQAADNCQEVFFEKNPVNYASFLEKFEVVRKGLSVGNSFLLNLTERTPVETNLSSEQIFELSEAPYKIFYPGKFVCFSPESFVHIKDGVIKSFPMKGTIDASVENAEKTLLDDYKERCEHYTIVDLIRNDLNRVAREVSVERFRYIDKVKTLKGEILQTSSEITGKLPDDYLSSLGDMLFELLPAGSISGAPKDSTLQIIREAEKQKRGYYTGIFGYFDGSTLESAVMIRFIELDNKQLYYRSGGGITINSCPEDEYKEMIEKVYLPIPPTRCL